MARRRQARFAAGAAWLLALVAGCAGIDPQPTSPPAAVREDIAEGGEFVVAESMLDTWNTIGKILVALEGVRYEGRSQMLGLYIVRYRGEPFLVRARAMTIDGPSQGLGTRVDALDSTGKPFHGPAATALLRILAERVPREVARYRQPVDLPHPSSRKREKTR